jgi:hypothetical protein
LPAHCCQPAVAGGVIYADIWGELSTHLALQALFAQISPVREPLLQAFPFPSTGKGDTAPAFSGLHVYLQFMWEVGLPPSPVEFSSHRHSHQLPCSGSLGAPQLSPEALRPPGLFIYSPGKGSLPPNFGAQCAPPSFLHVLFVPIAYYSVSLFFSGWRSVCPGGYAALAQACLWEYCCTTKLTWSTSSQAVWVPATGGLGTLLVSPFNVEIQCPGWRCGGVKVMPLLSDYACKVCLWRLSKISL